MPEMDYYGCYDVEMGGQDEQFSEREDCEERRRERQLDRNTQGIRRCCGCWCWCCGCWRWCWCSRCCCFR